MINSIEILQAVVVGGVAAGVAKFILNDKASVFKTVGSQPA